MENQLLEAHINSSGASKTEIATSFNEAYDVIRRIVKKYIGMRDSRVTLVDQVTFVVSFVHPEIKDLNTAVNGGAAGYMNTPSSILDNYAVEVPVDTADGKVITESKLPFLNQPMVSLLNAVSGGILNKMLNAQPRGAYETDDSSSFGTEEFERKADEIQKFVLDNDAYTTKGFISDKLGVAKGDIVTGLNELNEQIDYDSLFGFKRADLTNDPNGDDAWGVLKNLEHWFYALVSSNLSMDSKVGETEALGESVYTYVKALRNVLLDNDVVNLLHAIDMRIMNPTVGDVEIAERGELMLNSDLFQLGTLMCLTPNATMSDGQPLFDYLVGKVDREEYAAAIQKLADFVQAPLGVDKNGKKKNLKVITDKWTPNLLSAVAQSNAQEHDNSVAATLAKQLSRAPKLSATLNMLKSNGAAPRTVTSKYAIAAVIANMVTQFNPDDQNENIECGLVADPANTPDDIGVNVKLTPAEQKQKNNVIKSPMELANDFTNYATPQKTSNLLTQRETVVSILDPSVDDVQGSVVLPKWAVPMFSTDLKFEKGDNETEQKVSNRASVLIAYSAIAYNNDEIEQFPWFSKRSEASEEDGSSVTVINIENTGTIDDVAVATAIEHYFNWIVTESTDASNVVRLRNGWVETLNNPQSWEIISSAIGSYLREYISSLPVADADETMTLINALDNTIIPGAKAFVNRNVFNVKEGSRDVQLSNDVTALNVKPISPVNLSENGRLRESGGDEGTVTSDGKILLNNTMGKVVKVQRREDVDKKTGTATSNNVYKVHFKQNSGLVSGEFTDRMIDNWIPNGLVVAVDSASKITQYALWVGVNFVDLQTPEGNLGSFRTSPEEIQASNAEYMNSVVGSPSYMDASPNAVQAGNFLNTVSAPALGAVRRVGDIISKTGSKLFSQVSGMLNFAASPKLSSDRMFDDAIKLSEIGKKSAEQAAADIMGGVANVFAATKMDMDGEAFYCDVDSTRTLHEILALCGRQSFERSPKQCASRLSSALISLAQVADNPFVIESADSNMIEVGNNGEDLSHSEQFGANGNGEAFDSLVNELMQDGVAIRNALDGDNAELNGLYAAAIEHLEEFAALFDGSFMEAFAVSGQNANNRARTDTERAISQYSALLTKQDAYDALAGMIRAIMPELRVSPEVMNRSLVDVLNSTYYARQIPDELAANRQAVTGYDRFAGKPVRKTVTGSDGAEDLVTPDYTGEHDDFSGGVLTNSIDTDALMNFRADETRSTYEGISEQFPMMNMVACDARGMYSGNGNFSVSTGINPPEFEKFAAALDSAHETMAKIGDDAVGKNVAINLYTTGKNFILEKAIDAFYGFMTSQKPLARRNILADAVETGRYLFSVVDECQDVTVLHALNKITKAYASVLAKVNNQVSDSGDEYDEDYLQEQAARQISTAIANIVLYLDSMVETEMPTADPTGLEVYGKRNRGEYAINSNIADKFATASAINPDAKRSASSKALGKRILSLTKTRMTQEIRNKFRDSMEYGVNEVDRFADTLSNIYDRIGKTSTLGYENAISPFDDLLSKSQAKHDKPYKTLYTGESLNDLGAVIMFAIVSDERNRNPGTTTNYGMVENMVNMLTGNVSDEASRGHQGAIPVPKYLLGGLSVVSDDGGRKKLDYGSMVWAMFKADGSSVVGWSPDESSFREVPPAFTGLGAIGDAIQVPLSDDDTIDEAVSKIRRAIIERKINRNKALEALARKDAGTNKKIYSETIENFVDTMMAAAGVTLNRPRTFVPLSVLYTCLDDKALNTAMHNVIEKASTLLRQKQGENASEEIMRSMAGDQYGEIPEVGEIAKENQPYLVDDFKHALQIMRSGVGTAQSRMNAAIRYRNSNEIDGETVDVPGSSLRELFGDQRAKECVDTLMHQVPMHVLASMDDDDFDEYARSFVRTMVEKNNVADTSKPLADIADALTGIADGTTKLGTGVHDITTAIGARNDTFALNLVKRYFDNLGVDVPNRPEEIADISTDRMRNVAIQTVNRELNTKGEFRSMYLHKYPTAGNMELQARKVMHGKVHPFGTSAIGDVNGLSVMYEKVANALSGKTDSEEGAELLSGVFFNIDGLTGASAITSFNKYFADLKKKLASVLRSTNTGVTAQLKLNSGIADGRAELMEKVNANKCSPDDPLSSDSQSGAGPARALAMAKLDETAKLITDSIGKDSTNSVAMFRNALRQFLEQHCVWNSDMSDEELTRVKNASKVLGNKELDADYVALRDGVAAAFASSDNRYQRDVKSVVGMPSSATGINVDLVLPPSKLRSLADAMTRIKDSPIKKCESDMHDAEYEVDGKPVSWSRCMVILNSALHMCETKDNIDTGAPLRDLITDELFQCVRRCASSVRDLPLMPDSIASILLTTMFKKKFISMSPIDGCVRMKHRFNRAWFIFDIPVSTIYEMVEDKISHTDLSKSLNEWKAFADEIDKYTNAGNRLNSYKITNPAIGNQLWDLFSSVQRSVISQVDNYLDRMDEDDFNRLCQSKDGMDTDDGIHITKARVEDRYDYNDDEAANAFPARRGRTADEDRSQDIEFPERFPRDRRPLRAPEEPDEPAGTEQAAPGEPEDEAQ